MNDRYSLAVGPAPAGLGAAGKRSLQWQLPGDVVGCRTVIKQETGSLCSARIFGTTTGITADTSGQNTSWLSRGFEWSSIDFTVLS